MPKPPSPTPKLDALIRADPDLVDRIFEYILAEYPEFSDNSGRIKAAVRAEFRGEECYIASRPATERQRVAQQVLSLFNGRNTNEVARRLQIGRTTVWRIIKQADAEKKRSTFPGNGTPPALP